MLAKKKKTLKIPLVKILYKLRVKPNHLTITSLILALISLTQNFWTSMTFFGLSFILDVLDGNLARRYKLTSKFGGFLDSITDKLVELLFIYYLSVNFNIASLGIIASGLSIMISYAKHRSRLELHTFFDRAERLIYLLIGMILFNDYAWLVMLNFIILCSLALTQLIIKVRSELR